MTTEEIAKLINSFKEKENCYNTLLSAIPDILFLMDIAGNYIKFQTGKGFLFIPISKIVGSNIKDSGMPADVIEKIMNHNTEAIETGSLSEITYSLQSPGGVTHYYESRAVRYDEYKSLRIVRDISEKVFAQHTIDNQIAQLESVARIAADELRKPIAGMLDAINSADGSTEQMQEVLQEIKNYIGILDQKVSKINQTLKNKSR